MLVSNKGRVRMANIELDKNKKRALAWSSLMMGEY